MDTDYTLNWLNRGHLRRRILMELHQPSTAKQLARRHSVTRDGVSEALAELAAHRLVLCITPEFRRSRLYWLTDAGARCQRRLREATGMPHLRHNLPELDWHLYAWVCYTHRQAIIKALDRPMQPSEIKKRAKFNDPSLRMSANNVRDVIRLFLAKGLVMPVRRPRNEFMQYDLTDPGQVIRNLLLHNCAY